MKETILNYDYKSMSSLDDGNEFFETVLGGLSKTLIDTNSDTSSDTSSGISSESDSDSVSTDYNYSDDETDKSDISELSDSPFVKVNVDTDENDSKENDSKENEFLSDGELININEEVHSKDVKSVITKTLNLL